MASDDIAISVRNLAKTYRLFGHPGGRIKQFLSLGLNHLGWTASRPCTLIEHPAIPLDMLNQSFVLKRVESIEVNFVRQHEVIQKVLQPE